VPLVSPFTSRLLFFRIRTRIDAAFSLFGPFITPHDVRPILDDPLFSWACLIYSRPASSRVFRCLSFLTFSPAAGLITAERSFPLTFSGTFSFFLVSTTTNRPLSLLLHTLQPSRQQFATFWDAFNPLLPSLPASPLSTLVRIAH